jgi:hypothetical protein
VSWLDPADVAAYAQYPDDADSALVQATDAAAVYVAGVRPEFVVIPTVEVPDPDPAYVPNDDVKLGAVMLAARWFQRRGTLLGVSGFSEFGGGILRHDPDIARLLGIGPHRAFVFGAPSLPVEEEEAEA